MRAVLVVALAACGGSIASSGASTGATPPETLYLRLGGEPGVKAVVKDFVEENVVKDARIKAYFDGRDLPHLEQMLVAQICNATGGGCPYLGKDMKAAHAGLHVTDEDFAALVEDLGKSLETFKVREPDKRELLNALREMRRDIITSHPTD